MQRLAGALAFALLVVAAAHPAGAQIAPPNEAGVAMHVPAALLESWRFTGQTV